LRAVLRRRRLVVTVAGGALVALGSMIIVLSFVYPAAPGDGSPYPAAIGFGVFGAAVLALRRFLAPDAETVAAGLSETVSHCAERVARALVHGPVTVAGRDRRAAVALVGLIVWPVLLALMFLIEATLHKLRAAGAPIATTVRIVGYVAVLMGAAVAAYRRSRVGFLLDADGLAATSSSGPAAIKFRDLVAVQIKERVLVVRDVVPAGFRITMTLIDRWGTSLAITSEFLFAGRPLLSRSRELESRDLICWLWHTKGAAPGMKMTSAYLPAPPSAPDQKHRK
jgi:hypothetical protein